MKNVVVVLCTLCLGLVIGSAWQKHNQLRSHWKVIEDYKAYFTDSTWRSRGEQDAPLDPEASLGALVTAGVLRHVDIVFPNVRYAVGPAKYWMNICSHNSNIVFAVGNPSYRDLNPRGEQPLHINLWFRESATRDVVRLISDIDCLWGDKGHVSTSDK